MIDRTAARLQEDPAPPGPDAGVWRGGLDPHQLAKALGGVVLILDSGGHILDGAVSDPAWMGQGRTTLSGVLLADFLPTAVSAKRSGAARRVLAAGTTETFDYQTDVLGSQVWFQVSVTRLTDREALWIGRDVSEQRRYETLAEFQRSVLSGLSSGASLINVLLSIVQRVEAQFEGITCAILRLEGDTGKLVHVAAPGLPAEYIAAIDGMDIGPSAGSCGTAVFRREAVIVEDIEHDPLWDSYRTPALRFGLKSCWSRPILSIDGRPVGTFACYYTETKRPRQAELDLMEAAAYLAGIAFERSRADETYRKSEQARQEMEAMLAAVRQASIGLAKSLEFPGVLDDVLKTVYGLMSGARNVHIYLYDTETDELSFGAAVRADGLTRPWATPRPEGLTRTVARRGRRIVVPDMNSDPLYAQTPGHWGGAIAGIPLRVGDRVVGVMSVAYDQPRAFADTELRELELLADQAASAIENARLFQAERAAREHAEALRETAATLLTPGLDRQQVLQLILEQLARVVDYDSASIILTEVGQPMLAAHRGLRSNVTELQSAMDLGTMEHIRQVIESHLPVIIPDVTLDSRWQRFGLEPAGRIRCWLGVPLISKDRVIGVLNIDKETPQYYTQAHGLLAWAFANQAALAIEQTHLYEVLAGETDRLKRLNQLGRDLSARLDPDRVYEAIHRAAAELMPADVFIIALVREQLSEVQIAYLVDKGARWPGLSYPSDKGLSAMVLRSGRPLRIDNLEQFGGLEPVRVGDAEHSRSLVMVPMFLADRAIGVLSVQSYSEHSYTDIEEQTLSTLASQAAIAIENARLYAESRSQLADQRLLFECSQALAQAHANAAVLEIVAEKIGSRFGATALTYYSYDESTRLARVDYEYWSATSSPRERRSVAGQIADLSSFPTTLDALTRRMPVAISRSLDSLTADERESLEAFDGQSMITVPLVLHDRAVGFFEIWNSRQEYTYSESDRRVLASLATLTATAMENVKLFAETHRQSLELSTLLDAARAVSSTLELDQIMTIIARKMAETIGAVGCTISRWDREHDQLVTWVTWRQRQVEFGDQPGATYDLAKYPASREVLVGRSWRLVTSTDALVAETETTYLQQTHASSLLMLPLIVSERVIGLVEVIEDSFERKFAADEIDLIQGMTNQAAVAIANAQLFTELDSEKRRIELLYDLSQNLTTSLDPFEVGRRALERMCKEFGAFQGAVYVVAQDSERIHLVALTNADQARIERLDRQMAMTVGHGLTGWVAQNREAIVIDDVLSDTRWVFVEDLDERVRSVITTPLIAGNNLVGVLNMSAENPGAFRSDQLLVLGAAVMPVAAALHNAQLFHATRRQALEVQAATSVLHALNASADYRQAFPTLAAGLRRMTGCEQASLAMLDDVQEYMTLVGLDQDRQELDAGAVFPIGFSAAAGHILDGKAHMTPDLAVEISHPVEKLLFEAGHRSRLSIPLRLGFRVIGALNIVWREMFGYQGVNLDLLNQIADSLALAIEKNRLLDESQRRDAILESLAFGGQKLLMPGSLGENLLEALGHLGQVVGISRAHVFENHFADSGDLVTSQLFEWCAPEAIPQMANPALQNLSYAERLPRWSEILGGGNPLYGPAREMPADETVFLEALGIRSIALMPVFSAGKWWGVLGFDDCMADRRWTVAEIESLRNAAAIVGAAVARQTSEAAEREQRVLAEALRDSASVLNGTLNLEEVLDRILDSVGRVVPHDAAAVITIDKRDEAGYSVRRAGYRNHYSSELYPVMSNRTSPLRRMMETRRPLIVADTRGDGGWTDAPDARWVRSYLGAPIVVRNSVIGFISLESLTPGFFNDRHAEHLEAFASEAALALHNAQLFATTEWHVRSVTLLNEITQAALAATDYVSSLQLLVDKLGRLIGADGCYINLWDESRQRPKPAALFGLQPSFTVDRAGSAVQTDGMTLSEAVLQLGRAVIADDVEADPALRRWLQSEFGPIPARSLLALPLIVGDRKLGAVIILFTEPHRFAQEEIATGEQAASQVALAIFKGDLLDSERQQRVLAESLRDTAGALNSTLKFDEVLDQILANVGRVVPHDSASIMLAEDPSRTIDPIRDSVRIVRARGFEERGLGGWVLGLRFQVSDSPMLSRMLTSRQPIVVDETRQNPMWIPLVESAWIRSHLAAPIGLRGWVIGFINLDSAIPGFFEDVHAERLRVFADQAAVAIENSYLFDSVRQNADELSFLYRASAEMIRPGMELADLAAHIAAVITQEFVNAYCSVWFIDEPPNALRLIGESGSRPKPQGNLVSIQSPEKFAEAARNGQPVYTTSDSDGATISIPLVGGGRTIGVLQLEDRSAGGFSERIQRIMSAVAERASLALENAQLVVRLDRARRIAEEASQLKSEFLANTSHELRTPLTGIIGSLSMVLDNMRDTQPAERDDAEQREFIQIAYTSSEHLLDIINQVLDIAKIEAGRLEVELGPIPLAEVLDEVFLLSKVQADRKSLTLEMKASSEPIFVMAEAEKLRQILHNLVGNAIKFTDNGFVHIDVRREGDDWALVSVQDSGIGVPVEKQAKLFQPFVQADGSMTRKYGGTGLGLSISRRLAEMMGGSLTLYSAGTRKGTTLQLRLPLATEEMASIKSLGSGRKQ